MAKKTNKKIIKAERVAWENFHTVFEYINY